MTTHKSITFALLALIATTQTLPMQRLRPLANQLYNSGKNMGKNMIRVPALLGRRALSTASPFSGKTSQQTSKLMLAKSKPFNYRLWAGLGLTAGAIATQQKPAEAAPTSLSTYTIKNKHGVTIKLIIIGETNLADETTELAKLLNPYISDLVNDNEQQCNSFLYKLYAHSTPSQLFSEYRNPGGPDRNTQGQLTMLASDKRSVHDIATINWINNPDPKVVLGHFSITPQEGDDLQKIRETQLRKVAPGYAEKQKGKAYDIIDGADIDKKTKLIAKQAVDDIIAESLKPDSNVESAIENCANLVDDASLMCDLFKAIDNSERPVVLVVARHPIRTARLQEALTRKGITPTTSVNNQSFDQAVQESRDIQHWANAIKKANEDPSEKTRLAEHLTKKLGRQYLEKQRAFSPDEIIKVATQEYFNRIVVPEAYDIMSDFIDEQ